jgi:hypothetical protein
MLICLFVSVSSCNHKKHVTPQDNALYLVDLDEVELEDTIHVSSYFNRVTPIILETNEDCLIKEISNVQVIDSFIFILDREMQNLFCFNKTGKFLKQIGNRGASPEEYKALSDFTIDPQEGKIYLFDNYSWEVKVYDLNGACLSSFNCKKTISGQSGQIQYANNNLYLDFQPENLSSKKDAPLLCKFNRNTGDFERTLLSAKSNNLGMKQLMFTDDGVFYCRTQENTIYIPLFSNTAFTLRDEAAPYFSLHSKNFISERELNEIDMSDPTTLPKLFNSSKILSVWSYRETDNYIFILYKMGKVHDMIYSKKDGKARLCNWFFDDLVYKSRNKSVTHYPYASDAKGIYRIIRYHDMPTFLELVKSDETKLTKEQVAEIACLTEDANPILFYYETK